VTSKKSGSAVRIDFNKHTLPIKVKVKYPPFLLANIFLNLFKTGYQNLNFPRLPFTFIPRYVNGECIMMQIGIEEEVSMIDVSVTPILLL